MSVIVPALDEEAAIADLLDHLARLPGRTEIVVVDGGSSDRTVALARAHPARPRLVETGRGRAGQMNAGAAAATGAALVFLHADTRLPDDAHAQIAGALRSTPAGGGNFAVRFDGPGRFARVLTAWYALQRRLGVFYGDSAIWVRAGAFRELGGYRPLAIMEDYDLARRLRRRGRTACLPGPVRTSARRWERLGVARTIASWIVIRWLFVAGVSPERLARLYPVAR